MLVTTVIFLLRNLLKRTLNTHSGQYLEMTGGTITKSSDEVKSAVQLYKSADRKAKLMSIEIYTMELHMSKVKLG